MKPVNQLVSDAGKGDCWRCCIASILEISAEDVPNFVGLSVENSQSADYLAREWLNARGYGIVRVHEWHGHPPEDPLSWVMIAGLYAIASVPSQRFPGGAHAVVVQFVELSTSEVKLQIVHDPQPANKFYPDDTKFRRLEFIVPLRPRVTAPPLSPGDDAIAT